MSQENVEAVRRGVEAYNRADLDGFLAIMHPQMVWEENEPILGFVGLDPVYEGHDGTRRWWEASREPWEAMELEIEDITPAGDDAVVLTVMARGTGAGSGVAVQQHFIQLFEFRDGKIARRRLYSDRPRSPRSRRDIGVGAGFFRGRFPTHCATALRKNAAPQCGVPCRPYRYRVGPRRACARPRKGRTT
jgi:ketosteroid isomerase-like protein